jgi:acyl-CoA synthetase (NDP forming)
MVESLAAIAAAADAGLPATESAKFQNAAPLPGDLETLSEWDGKRQLAAHRVPVPDGALCETSEQAADHAARITYPVVVKAVGAQLAHKTEQGAVKLALKTPSEVRHAAAALLPITGHIIVERMVGGTIAELIVGVARDPCLGLYLVLGSGGILAELVGDTATLLLPASRAEIAHALNTLKVQKLLGGFRGAPEGDIQAAIDAIMAIQEFAMAHRDTLHELDVNPLMVRARGQGAVAADVLLRLSRSSADA